MKVKQVICRALRLVARYDVADKLEAEEELNDEQSNLRRAFLTYLNAAMDELARGYFPLEKVEKMHSETREFAFAVFSEGPTRIKRVTDGKNPVKWHIYPDYLHADAENITVAYEYCPAPLGEDDEFCYPVFAVSERLVEYAMAAEHFLVLGDAVSSAVWEEKYHDGIELLIAKSNLGGRIPPRRWI